MFLGVEDSSANQIRSLEHILKRLRLIWSVNLAKSSTSSNARLFFSSSSLSALPRSSCEGAKSSASWTPGIICGLHYGFRIAKGLLAWRNPQMGRCHLDA